MLELLKKVARAYSDLLDLKTPLGAGSQGERNTLADALATLSTGIATVVAVLVAPEMSERLHGVRPQTGDLLLAGFIVLMCWLLATYVVIAAASPSRFRMVAALNLNLVLVWFFISVFVAIVVAFLIGEPGNRATQSITAWVIVLGCVVLHVSLANDVGFWAKVLYGVALVMSVLVFLDRLYGYTEQFGMLRDWHDFFREVVAGWRNVSETPAAGGR